MDNHEQTPDAAPAENTTPNPPPRGGPAVAPPATIKEFRSRLDIFLNSFHLLHSSAEMTLAKRSLQISFSWLGEALKEQGSKTPYTSSEDPGSSHIEPLADHNPLLSLDTFFKIIEQTHTARVKAFRAKMTDFIADIHAFCEAEFIKMDQEDNAELTTTYGVALIFAVKAAKEAKIWMGWELGRIRDYLAPKDSTPASGAALPL